MGAESSRLSVIWSVLDDDKDGFISAAELEEWFRDEAFLDNRLFSPHHNGVTSIHALAQSFLHSVDRDRDSKVSYDDLKAYTEGMKEEEIEDLAQSLVEVNEDKKRKACKKVFTAIDYNNHGYWTQEDAERFIRNEVQYQLSRGATPEQCDVGARDMRLRLFPHPTVDSSAESSVSASTSTSPPVSSVPLDESDASRQPSSAPVVTFESLCAFFSTWPLREIRKHTEELVTSAWEKKRELTLQVIKQRRLSRSEVSSGGVESASASYSRSRFSSAGEEREMSEGGEMKGDPHNEEELSDSLQHSGAGLSGERRSSTGTGHGEAYSVSVTSATRTSSTSLPVSSAFKSSSSSSSLSSSTSARPLTLTLPPAALSDLLAQMAVLHDEISSLNAQQRQMNEDSRRMSDRLLSIDSSRLAISNGLNDIQAELTANHARHVSTTTARTNNEEKLKAVLKRFQECSEEGHRLAREVEVCRETSVSMKQSINELGKASKQVPDHLKALAQSVLDENAKLQMSTKVHKDAQHMIAMLESEVAAQEKAMQGGAGGGAQGQAALSRLRAKLAGYRKVEREKEEEMKASTEALKRWEEEKEGDEELKRIGGQMALYKTSLREKKEQLGHLQRDYDAQQLAQERLDTERRVLFNDILAAKKAEKLILTRIQQLSESYATADQQVAQLGRDKEELVKKTRALVDLQAQAESRMCEVMMELECLCDDCIKAKEEEEEEARHEELLMEEEEEAQRRELELKLANGWEPDETYVAPLPYARPEPKKPMLWCCPVWIDVEGRRIDGIVHINRFMLTVENCVHPQQRREDAVRVCVDVSELLDVKLKAADQTGQPTLTLQRMPSPIKAATYSPTLPKATTPPLHPAVALGAPPPMAMPVARPVSPRRPNPRNSSNSVNSPALSTTSASPSSSASAPSQPLSSTTPIPNSTVIPSTAVASTSSASPPTSTSSPSLSAVVSQAYVAASSLLDTVVGPVSEAVSHAASALVGATTASTTADTASTASTPSQPSSSSSLSSIPSGTFSSPIPHIDTAAPLVMTASFSASQPFSPALSPSTLQPSLRRTLSLAARQISLTLRPGYRNRFLVAVDDQSTSLSSPSNSSHHPTPVHRMALTCEEAHLKLLFQCLRHNIQTRRRKSFSSFALSPPSTPTSMAHTPTSAPSTPVRRALVPSPLVSQSAGKAKESFADRQARKKKKREKKERELQHRRELQHASEEVYVEGVSDILPLSFLQRLIRNTPARYHLSVWRCVYSMTVHGVSFNNLLASMQDRPCGLIVIQDMRGKRFGGYASNPFISNGQAMNAYYGTGECWVWEVKQKTEEEKAWDERDHVQPPASSTLPQPTPEQPMTGAESTEAVGEAAGGVVAAADETVGIYRWSGLNDFFMFTGTDPPFIAMGGGGAFAWRLDGSLRFGTSGECSTYQSPPLASQKAFEANLFEVWAPVHGRF